MAKISTLRKQVDLEHLSGDTLTISVKAPAALVDGLEWHAQVRISTGDADIQAEFDISPPVVPGEPAFLVLKAADTGRLAPDGGQFAGVWDVQVSAPGGLDPVITLAGGKLSLKPDVTRLGTVQIRIAA